jgi:hypothetical protein
MKIEIKVKKEVEIKTLKLKVEPRYWEDSTVNGIEDVDGKLIPFRNGDIWEPEIDIDKGVVIDWPIGMVAKIHYKVCDAGDYYLKDTEGNIVLSKEGYVPGIMPGEHYGDYIILSVDGDGKIENWDSQISIDDFDKDED